MNDLLKHEYLKQACVEKDLLDELNETLKITNEKRK
jgi:hypothetical protein